MQDNSALGRAVAMVRGLRRRCPWDRAQTRETLRPDLVEEALEPARALREGGATPWQRDRRRAGRGKTLPGIGPPLPPLLKAYRLQERAASVGFDWPDV